MNASEKKLVLFAQNQRLNCILDLEENPSSVVEYAKKIIANKDHYGWFWHSAAGYYNIRCAACQSTIVESQKPGHMSKQVCPVCSTELELRRSGRSRHFRKWENSNICFLQNFGDAIVARFFENNRYYTDSNYILTVEKNLKEYQRIIFRSEGVRKFFARSGYRNDKSWYSAPSIRETYTNYDMCQSKEELQKVISQSYLKNSPWLEHFRGRSVFTLYKLATWPTLEYLLKLGYKGLVNEIINGRTAEDKTLNLYRNKTNEVLGVPHSILQKYNHPEMKERDIKAMKQLIAFGRLGQLTQERFKFICSVLTNNSLDPLDIFRSFGIEKVLNYLDKQILFAEQKNAEAHCHYGYRKTTRETAWRDFQDYRRECHELGYDLTDEGILFPRDMYSAHSRTSELVRVKREREQKKRAAEQARVWKEQAAERERLQIEYAREQSEKYSKAIKAFIKKQFASNDFVLRVAQTAEEIIAEGKALKHCVGSYVDRVIARSSLIFVVRLAENPDKPLYTLELNYKTKKVVQCRGFSNAGAPPEVYQFIEQALEKLRIKAAG